MKKLSYLIILALILGLVLTGCSLLSNISQVPATGQSGITYLTKGLFSGLVGLWSFDEGEDPSIAYDSSGNNNNGTIHEEDYFPDQWGGQALRFDGVIDYVVIGHGVTSLITGDYTVEAWIKPASLASGRHAVVSFSYMELGYNAGKVYFWQAYDSSWGKGYLYTSPTVLLDVTKWSHIVGVHKKDVGIDLYVDGNYIGSDTDKMGTTLNIFGNTYAGQWYQASPAGAWFDGLIDEVRIWDNALSEGTIIDHAAGNYGFKGLLAPYVAPPKAFKAGRSIPLKWQYTDNFGDEVDSSAAEPSVKVLFKGTIDVPAEVPIDVEDSGESGYRYHSDKKTWQFNWQTKSCGAGRYEIWITSMQTGQVNGPIIIDLQ